MASSNPSLKRTRPYSYLAASLALVFFVYVSWSGETEALWFPLGLLGATTILALLGHSILALLVWLAPVYLNLVRLQRHGVPSEPIPGLFLLWFVGGIGFLLLGSWTARRGGLVGPARTWEDRPRGRAVRSALLGLMAGTCAALLQAFFFIAFLWGPASRGELVDATMQAVAMEALIGSVLPTAFAVGLVLGAALGVLAFLAYSRLKALSWVERGALLGAVILPVGALPFGLDLFAIFFLGPLFGLTFALLHSSLYESRLAVRLTHPLRKPSLAL